MKRGYLGIFESAYIAGRDAGAKEALKEKGYDINNKDIPLDEMIYVAAFQGGIDEFITMLKPFGDKSLPDFLNNRFKQPNKASVTVLPEILKVFEPYTNKDQNSLITMLMSFLIDLIMAMQNNASVIKVSQIPSIVDVRDNLPPELSLPIINIISQLKSTNALLPAPSVYLPKESIERLDSILRSDIYRSYSISHKNLEDSTQDSNKVINDIKSKGLTLLQKGKNVLSKKRVFLDVIPVVPKIVDAAFGKLPGLLAQIAGDSANKLLKDKENIVIYQFDDWAREFTELKTHHLLKNQRDSNLS